MRLSVIVPVYNQACYLRRCVDSVLAQTLPRDQYEVILVDDGSPDTGPAICDEYAACYSNVHVIHQSNQGVAMARNNGVKAANAPFVAFLDADDWWDTHYAESMLELAAEYPDAGLYACQYWYVKFGKSQNRMSAVEWETSPRMLNDARVGTIRYFRSYFAGTSMPIWTGAAMMPKSVFEAMGGFQKSVKLGEDFLLWAKTAIQYKIAYRERYLSYYFNDTPVSNRATRHVHEPKYHMIWHLQDIDSACKQHGDEQLCADWHCLKSKLLAAGLQSYWLKKQYHDEAQRLLSQVDWSVLPPSCKQWYSKPIAYHKVRNCIMDAGSKLKQRIYSFKAN